MNIAEAKKNISYCYYMGESVIVRRSIYAYIFFIICGR